MKFRFESAMPFDIDPTESRIVVHCEYLPSVPMAAIGWVDGLERELTDAEEAELLSGEYYDALEKEAEEAYGRIQERAKAAAEGRRENEWKEQRAWRRAHAKADSWA